MQVTLEGNHVYLNCEYTTGEASGQNMANCWSSLDRGGLRDGWSCTDAVGRYSHHRYSASGISVLR